ncbi:hypothetical protein CCM_09340 [Cordyceps militaris CM01]|uniref:Uncharacterized protein n=1 Tax=Cordyceps militaris (strain CM01) TaxID=983644 RepID=G3JUI2_CORMM|nr:uncharacterized protein CCM_09340 [Cordyceps militaris CM01]EGX87718.1 hypothetical protein CCM_09340 [Cordyceps militaris CM01]
MGAGDIRLLQSLVIHKQQLWPNAYMSQPSPRNTRERKIEVLVGAGWRARPHDLDRDVLDNKSSGPISLFDFQNQAVPHYRSVYNDDHTAKRRSAPGEEEGGMTHVIGLSRRRKRCAASAKYLEMALATEVRNLSRMPFFTTDIADNKTRHINFHAGIYTDSILIMYLSVALTTVFIGFTVAGPMAKRDLGDNPNLATRQVDSNGFATGPGLVSAPAVASPEDEIHPGSGFFNPAGFGIRPGKDQAGS